jgi:hypothetical protein
MALTVRRLPCVLDTGLLPKAHMRAWTDKGDAHFYLAADEKSFPLTPGR